MSQVTAKKVVNGKTEIVRKMTPAKAGQLSKGELAARKAKEIRMQREAAAKVTKPVTTAKAKPKVINNTAKKVKKAAADKTGRTLTFKGEINTPTQKKDGSVVIENPRTSFVRKYVENLNNGKIKIDRIKKYVARSRYFSVNKKLAEGTFTKVKVNEQGHVIFS